MQISLGNNLSKGIYLKGGNLDFYTFNQLMEILAIENRSDQKAWDRFVHASPLSVHYHLSGWKRVLEKTYENTTIYLMVRQKGEIRGILPLCLVRGFPSTPHLASLPYLSYAGVCAADATVANVLVQKAGEWMQEVGAKYVELHNTYQVEVSKIPAKTNHTLITNTDKVTMALPLPCNPDVLWKGFKAKVRNQVRKAEKSGLRVEVGRVEFLNNFYEVFAENMRDLGSPVHKIQLFQNLFEVFPNDTRIFMVYKDSQLVGGAIFLTFKDTAEVPWASSKREFLRDCPNNLLYWEILRYACEQGIREFDFGRSTKDSGTYRFKKQWGAIEKPLYWQYYLPKGSQLPDFTHVSLKSRILIGMWKKLPLKVANALGPRIRGNISA